VHVLQSGVFVSMMKKILAAVLLLMVVSVAGASACVRNDGGLSCEGVAALQCTTSVVAMASHAANGCCKPAVAGQLSFAPANSAKDELSGSANQLPNRSGGFPSVTRRLSARPPQFFSHLSVPAAGRTGQTIYRKTGRLRWPRIPMNLRSGS
jgi:hypothetical protein